MAEEAVEDIEDEEGADEEDRRQREFPCQNCGAKVQYTPGTAHLQCPYCQAKVDIPQSEEDIEELDFLAFLENAEKNEDQIIHESIQCDSCAATFDLDPNISADECPFCGTHIVAETTSKKTLKPKSLLPFHIKAKEANQAYRSWLKSLWFAPNKLKTYAQVEGKIRGMYIPYWTYDADATSYYRGKRGKRRTKWVRGADGKSKMVTEMRWRSVSGCVFDRFDDVLVLASDSLPKKQAYELEPWDLKNLVPYDEQYLAGFGAENYQINLEKGFDIGNSIMAQKIHQTIRRDIGGDAQRITSVKTSYKDIRFKHILLPIWINAYRYQNKTYRFLINARTGEVQGERPWSWIKITFAILAGLALIALIFILNQPSSGNIHISY